MYGLPFVFGAVLASVTEMIEHYEKVPGPDAYSSRTRSRRALRLRSEPSRAERT
nr:hypothetical protein [Nannocystis sp.]